MKILITDEILTTGKKMFNEYLNLSLELIKNNKLPFAGVYVISRGDFLQFTDVMYRSVFQVLKTVDYNLGPGKFWI